MYKEYSGRIWSSEDAYLQYRKNVRKYMQIWFALENYADYTNDESIFKEDVYRLTGEFNKDRDNLSEGDVIKRSSLLIEKFNELLDKIGREKFIFYDDDGVEFNWPKS